MRREFLLRADFQFAICIDCGKYEFVYEEDV